jgi:flagellar motor switch protein FliN
VRHGKTNGELILTNLNLVYITTKGVFKTTYITQKYPINQIKVFNGKAQVILGKNGDIDIYFRNEQESFRFWNNDTLFSDKKAEKEAAKWVNAINQLIAGQVPEFDIDAPIVAQDDSEMLIVPLEIEGSEKSCVAVIVPKALADQFVEKNSSTAPAQKPSGNIGLNMSEIDELSKVTSFDSANSTDFTETNIAGVPVNAPRENIEMLLDIDLDVSIELGRSQLSIKRILELAPGSIVELDRMAGEPVDLLVNNKVVARGEVVVIDESFGIRIVSLVSPEERIKSLK